VKRSPRENSIFDYDSPRESTTSSTTSFASSAASFASSGIYSPESEMFGDKSESENAGTPVQAPHLLTLSERRDLNPNVLRNITPKSNVSTKMDYTPSPLSMVSTGFNSGFIILTSSHMEDVNQEKAIEFLHFRGLKYRVVDGMDPAQAKR